MLHLEGRPVSVFAAGERKMEKKHQESKFMEEQLAKLGKCDIESFYMDAMLHCGANRCFETIHVVLIILGNITSHASIKLQLQLLCCDVRLQLGTQLLPPQSPLTPTAVAEGCASNCLRFCCEHVTAVRNKEESAVSTR